MNGKKNNLASGKEKVQEMQLDWFEQSEKDANAVFVDLKNIWQSGLEETHGDPEENWCGLEGEEALK